MASDYPLHSYVCLETLLPSEARNFIGVDQLILVSSLEHTRVYVANIRPFLRHTWEPIHDSP